MNSSGFTPKARLYLAILMAAFGLFVVIASPFLIQGSLDAILARVIPKIPKEPSFAMTVIVLPTWFIIMRGINVVAGITLIVTAWFFYQGKKWAWPVALSASSLPTIFGVLHNLPHIVQYSRPPAAISILVFGLVTYLCVLMFKAGNRVEKWARFLVFTLLGVTAGHINVLVMHSLKCTITRPEAPYFSDIMNTVYTYEGPINFIAFIFCIVAIPLLASENRKFAGWMLALIAGISVAVANYPTHIIRMQTSDFMVGGTLGLGLAVFALIPAFRKALLSED
jgi:hypothetical protein